MAKTKHVFKTKNIKEFKPGCETRFALGFWPPGTFGLPAHHPVVCRAMVMSLWRGLYTALSFCGWGCPFLFGCWLCLCLLFVFSCLVVFKLFLVLLLLLLGCFTVAVCRCTVAVWLFSSFLCCCWFGLFFFCSVLLAVCSLVRLLCAWVCP